MKVRQLTTWIGQYWPVLFFSFLALFVTLPWLAPVFMYLGWAAAANAIYTLYSTQCHQLPQRSFFLFGSQIMYDLETIQNAWQNSYNPLILRQFVGNSEMGWKVAWSDRMVYMYTSLLGFALLFWPLRKRINPLPLWGFLLLLLPMALDGTTHAISDYVSGIGGGFRDHNQWLAIITNHQLSPSFYVGDALGSFNAWMRLLSGVFFGLALVWFIFPHLALGYKPISKAQDIGEINPDEYTHPRSLS